MEPLAIVTLFIGLCSIFTNGILLLILFFDPLKKFRPLLTTLFIISLAISDLITGATGVGFAIYHGNRILYTVLWASIISSFSTICLMSWERLIVVTHPFKAKSIIRKRRVLTAIAISWTVSIAIGVVIYIYYTPSDRLIEAGILSICFICILFNVVLLCVIYAVIIYQMNKVPPQLQASRSRRSRESIKNERRLTGVLILLVLTLLLTVVPYIVASVMFGYFRLFQNDQQPPGLITFITYYFPVELINFAVNPLIYAWRLPDYRKSLFHYLKKFPKCGKNDEENVKMTETTELRELEADA